jgi:acyl-[acyl-carrier-protein]-phospholipid O-acyltransferase/long-chain-fatty-acid--[acyl-carrier-protein] ligase
MNTVSKIVRPLVRLLLRLFYRVEVRGELKASERMLIIANHESFLDPILLWAFLPISPTYLVHTTIASRWYFRPILAMARHAVADTTKPMAIKAMVNLVESGEPVIIFPEGRITITGSLMKVYDGPAFVAAKTQCVMVPVHIDGTIYSPFSRMSGDFPRKLFPRITITIQPGATLPMPEAPRARDRRRLASEQMRRIIQRAAYASRRRTSLFNALVDAVELHGRSRRVLEDINTNFAPVSYGTILKGSLALGRLIARLAQESEIVGVLMPNANATVYLLFGMATVRRVPAMLNFTSGIHGVENACRVAQIKVVLTSRAFVEKANLQNLVAGLKDVRIVYLEDLRPQFTFADKVWLIAWALRRPRRVCIPTRPEEPALVMFTSGSEGVPKGVVLSHDSILANVAQIGAAYPFSAKEKFLSALPLFHAFGITGGILVPLLKGCRVVLYPSPLHYRTIPEFVYDHDCTVLFTTNTFLGKYAKAAHPYDFYNLRHLVVGAEKLSEDVRQICCDKFGLRPLEGYGATECSPVIAVSTPLANRPGSVGEILPGMDYRVASVEGLRNGGVLHVRGDNVMLGYLTRDRPGVIQPPTSEFGPGWYNTGDVVSVADDYITIMTRLKRFAKVAGEMVSLELVEQIAAQARETAVHAASTYKDSERGEVVILFTNDATLNRDQLKAAARRIGAPEIAIPRSIIHLEEIPLLGNGKKDYVTLSKKAQEISRRSESLV